MQSLYDSKPRQDGKVFFAYIVSLLNQPSCDYFNLKLKEPHCNLIYLYKKPVICLLRGCQYFSGEARFTSSGGQIPRGQ